MSYNTVADIAYDTAIQRRVAACGATEALPNPVQWASERAWQLAAQPGWAAAWQSALAAHPEGGYLPGRDEAAITDAMILAAVQSLTSEGGS